jgi:DNA-binding CsgD family transcriptional regulator
MGCPLNACLAGGALLQYVRITSREIINRIGHSHAIQYELPTPLHRCRPQFNLTRERQAAASGKTAKLSVEEQYLDAAPRKGRRPGYVFNAPWRGLPERPWFDALFVSGDPSMVRPSAKQADSRREAIPPLPLGAAHWEAVAEAMGLSDRQAEIAELLVRGAQLKEIASTLDIAISTIRSQHERILAKAGVNRPSELHARILGLSHQVGHCQCRQNC